MNVVGSIILDFITLVVGFVMLIKGADAFVDASSKVATKFNVPQIVIGLTIVAFGTSAPEAAVSITSALRGSTGISIGNVLGSNIMNVLLILGITAAIAHMHIQKTTVVYEMPFLIVISAVLFILGQTGDVISRLDGAILWAFFIGFFIYLIILSKSKEAEEAMVLTEKDTMPRLFFFIVLGIACIVIGSNLAVNGATGIAEVVGVSDRIIGLTIVAFGTSLPELVTSVMAARKGQVDLAVGNIIGSNTFNILFVLGTTALIKPIPFAAEFNFDAIVGILVAVLLFLLSVRKKELGRPAGIIMLIFYAAYFAKLVLI
ncbi:MAG: calcium/sodium antiporter [Lachnospiraceae bacterium]|nr:calcium/sodium antiporter [Lachnospiraceae bacterium]